MSNINQEALLLQAQAQSFLAHDLLLFLDTHPDSAGAWNAYRDALRARREAMDNYSRQVHALTADSMADQTAFDWPEGPFPWQ